MADAVYRAVAEWGGAGLPIAAAISVGTGFPADAPAAAPAAAAAATLRAELPRLFAALPAPARPLYSFHIDVEVKVAGEVWVPERCAEAAFGMLAAAQAAVLYPRARLFAPPPPPPPPPLPLGLDTPDTPDCLTNTDPALDDGCLSPEFVGACDHIFGVCNNWAPVGAKADGEGGGGDPGAWGSRQWAMFFRVVNGVSPTASEVGAFHREVDTLMALTAAEPDLLPSCDSDVAHHARSAECTSVPMRSGRFQRWLVALTMTGQADRCWRILRAFG